MTQNPNKKVPHKGEGHRKRFRDRFLKSGLDGFHDYEVIELLLTSSIGFITYLFAFEPRYDH